jgi:DNA-binding response OmpR family regulator
VRLLLIDDAETTRFALNEYFRAKGYTTSCARNLDEAELLRSEGLYDAVIFDVNGARVMTRQALDEASGSRALSLGKRVVVLVACDTSDIPLHKSTPAAHVVPKPLPLSVLEQIILG